MLPAHLTLEKENADAEEGLEDRLKLAPSRVFSFYSLPRLQLYTGGLMLLNTTSILQTSIPEYLSILTQCTVIKAIPHFKMRKDQAPL